MKDYLCSLCLIYLPFCSVNFDLLFANPSFLTYWFSLLPAFMIANPFMSVKILDYFYSFWSKAYLGIFHSNKIQKQLIVNQIIYMKKCVRSLFFVVKEHIKNDNKSHIFKHLHSTATCFDSYNSLCVEIIDKANSKFDLKIKKLYVLIGENPN